jgi:hypothetical protein
MRVAVSALLGAFAFVALPLAANAVPSGPAVPESLPAPGVQLVAGGCGPGWHPVPPHFTPRGHWIPPAPHFW